MAKPGTAESVSTTTLEKLSKLHIRLSSSTDHTKILDLEFNLVYSSFLPKWINCMLHAQQRQDSISEPWAFYNLNNQWTEQHTLDFLNSNIQRCNQIHAGLFDRTIQSTHDQDTLNYLHSIFELHHGQLDAWKTNTIFDNEHGNELRQCLSHINQTIHRCEGQGGNPKLRVVYFDLPKTETFDTQDYEQFTHTVDFGGVYTCYADVGKNLESLATDDDDHHHDFVPNLHYSADFYVQFYNSTGVDKANKYKNYYKQNRTYFDGLGYAHNDVRLTTGAIKLAQLKYDNEQHTLSQISDYDNIQSAYLI